VAARRRGVRDDPVSSTGCPNLELGALLWLLSPPDDVALRLGAGKPLGFGAVRTEVDWQTTHLWTAAGLAAGWRSLQRPDPELPEALHELAATFDEVARTHQVLAEVLDSFVAAGKPVPHPVHYPRKITAPVAETFEWFVENERDRGGTRSTGGPCRTRATGSLACPTCPENKATRGTRGAHPSDRQVWPEPAAGRRTLPPATRTRSFKIVIECSQPIRSAITVAGIRGSARNNSRICGSTASTNEPRAGRAYFGARSDANAARTVFRRPPAAARSP
jgi:hypothetical protein